jgi:hypothetical protein
MRWRGSGSTPKVSEGSGSGLDLNTQGVKGERKRIGSKLVIPLLEGYAAKVR